MNPTCDYAISIKQPWATLLVHARKTIEVRRWMTARRGQVLIHAARVSDERKEAWDMVPEELLEEAKQTGGIIGQAELTDCLAYRTLDTFKADQAKHLNDPLWFQPPLLYGFVFQGAKPLPFRPFPGWLRFFPVDEKRLPEKKRAKLSGKNSPTLFD